MGAITSMRRERQAHGERCTFAEPAFDAEPAAMAVEHVLDQRKPEPGAALGAALADVDAIEPLGQPRQMLRRNARPVIANADDRLAAAIRGLGTLGGDVDALARSA